MTDTTNTRRKIWVKTCSTTHFANFNHKYLADSGNYDNFAINNEEQSFLP